MADNHVRLRAVAQQLLDDGRLVRARRQVEGRGIALRSGPGTCGQGQGQEREA